MKAARPMRNSVAAPLEEPPAEQPPMVEPGSLAPGSGFGLGFEPEPEPLPEALPLPAEPEPEPEPVPGGGLPPVVGSVATGVTEMYAESLSAGFIESTGSLPVVADRRRYASLLPFWPTNGFCTSWTCEKLRPW